MRTTIDLPDEIHELARYLAASRGESLGSTIAAILREAIDTEDLATTRERFVEAEPASGLLLLAYPGFWRGVGWGAVSAVLLAAAPLVVAAPGELVQIYRDWLGLLGTDHSVQYGYSVMGWLATWFQWQPSKTAVLGAGLLLLVLPYLRRSAFADAAFRLQLLAFLLIWLVIFNHMAESPTFVIAMTGVALWFVPAAKDRFTVALFALAFLLTSLSATDLFPRDVREAWVKPYVLKAVPCIIIAAVLWGRLMFPSFRTRQATAPDRTLPPRTR